MKVSAFVIDDAYSILAANQAVIAHNEAELPIGCTFCANCSGIVGG